MFTDCWIEEATEISRAAHMQLQRRLRGGDFGVPKRLIMSFNPIIKTHWIFKKFFSYPGFVWDDDRTLLKTRTVLIVKTWYIHNRFLTKQDVELLENESDSYMYQVYTLGNWGVLGDIIFTNWEMRDLKEKEKTFANFRYGLDFGFGVDPVAFVKTGYEKSTNTLYVFGEFVATGLSNQELVGAISPLLKGGLLICDSSEPKSIKELQSMGIAAIGAKKGQGSINTGIRWLRGVNIVVDRECINVLNELSLYTWRKDRFGESLPFPKDANNHTIDAIRYANEDLSMNGDTVLW